METKEGSWNVPYKWGEMVTEEGKAASNVDGETATGVFDSHQGQKLGKYDNGGAQIQKGYGGGGRSG